MTGWTALRYAVVDVEGNGRQPPDVVELAVVPITSGTIGDPRSWLVKPTQPITPFATRIHGIADKDVADAPAFEEIKDEVLEALKDRSLVAHNAHVDIGVLQPKLGDWQCSEIFDTLKLARRLFPGQKSYRLGSLVRTFDLANELPAGAMPHRAAYDALVTARLFVRLAGEAASPRQLRSDVHREDPDEASSLF